ncbi:MAG TPA: transporter [Smithellaceae bacterium]|jgi:hypothetical protein|nr:MAG: hypothetical protein BWX45_00416 [Deltaproteobacteria bacterium ADurb.Bin002]HNV57589.1 transporter [Smithellaceae bacterium]HNY95349.1 transporter [Smithellaceae bacterium]HOE23850.1 transporter [Smithellaceae bacterium]HOH58037.1 transporter [Smithellaceae bacterium]
MFRIKKIPTSLILLLVLADVAFAAHPLITDDANTQGRGNVQVEVNGQISINKYKVSDDDGEPLTVRSRESELKTTVSYGIVDSVDAMVTIPYQWETIETGSSAFFHEDGVADVALEIKWLFLKKNGFLFALKPGITLPVGDTDKNLGSGRMNGSLFLITTREMTYGNLHLSLGYIRNENSIDQKEDIWHASLAGEWKVVKALRLVANAGMEENPDKLSSVDRAFVLGGVIFSPAANLDIDAGIKAGLTDTETDWVFMGGVTFRF